MRTNIDIDDNLMEQAQSLSGIKTKREIVNQALECFLRELKRNELLKLRGKIVWEGDLNEMRQH